MEEQKCHADEAGTKGCCTDRIKHRDGKEYKLSLIHIYCAAGADT